MATCRSSTLKRKKIFFEGGALPRYKFSIPEVDVEGLSGARTTITQPIRYETSPLDFSINAKPKSVSDVLAAEAVSNKVPVTDIIKPTSIKNLSVSEKGVEAITEQKAAQAEALTVSNLKIARNASKEAELSAKLGDPVFKANVESALGNKLNLDNLPPIDDIRTAVNNKLNDLKNGIDTVPRDAGISAADAFSTNTAGSLENDLANLDTNINNTIENFTRTQRWLDQMYLDSIMDIERNTLRDHINDHLNAQGNRIIGNRLIKKPFGEKIPDPILKKGLKRIIDDEKAIKEEARKAEKDSGTHEAAQRDRAEGEGGIERPRKEPIDDPHENERIIDDHENVREKARKAESDSRDHEIAERERGRQEDSLLSKFIRLLLLLAGLILPIIHFKGPTAPPPPTVPLPIINLPQPRVPVTKPPTLPITPIIIVPLIAAALAAGLTLNLGSGAQKSYLYLQLTNQPDTDIDFTIGTQSGSLNFVDDTFTISADNWNIPIKLEYNCYLQKDLPDDIKYNYDSHFDTLVTQPDTEIVDISDKKDITYSTDVSVATTPTIEKITPKILGSEVIGSEVIGSEVVAPEVVLPEGALNEYAPTQSNIKKEKMTLKKLLEPEEDISSILSNVNNISNPIRIRKRGGSITPIYDDEQYTILKPFVIPTYDDEETEPYIEKVIPSIRFPKGIDDEGRILEEEIIPTYEDGYSEYTPMVGGEESQDNQDNQDNQQTPQDYIDALDYNSLKSEIDHTNLDNSYKAEFIITLNTSVSYELDISLQTDDGDWHIAPTNIVFDPTRLRNKMYFFSQKLYTYLENAYVKNKAHDISGNFHSSIADYKTQQQQKIQDSYDKQKQDVYNTAYQNAYDNHIEQIQTTQNVSDQLNTLSEQSGGKKKYKYIKKLLKKTRRNKKK